MSEGEKDESRGNQNLNQEKHWCHGKVKKKQELPESSEERDNNDRHDEEQFQLIRRPPVDIVYPNTEEKNLDHNAASQLPVYIPVIECDSPGSDSISASGRGDDASNELETTSSDSSSNDVTHDIEMDYTAPGSEDASAAATPAYVATRQPDRMSMSDEDILKLLPGTSGNNGHPTAFEKCKYTINKCPQCTAISTENTKGFCTRHFCDLVRMGVVKIPKRTQPTPEHKNEEVRPALAIQRKSTSESSDPDDRCRYKARHSNHYDVTTGYNTPPPANDDVPCSIPRVYSSGNDSPPARAIGGRRTPPSSSQQQQVRKTNRKEKHQPNDVIVSGEDVNYAEEQQPQARAGVRKKKAKKPKCCFAPCYNESHDGKHLCKKCLEYLKPRIKSRILPVYTTSQAMPREVSDYARQGARPREPAEGRRQQSIHARPHESREQMRHRSSHEYQHPDEGLHRPNQRQHDNDTTRYGPRKSSKTKRSDSQLQRPEHHVREYHHEHRADREHHHDREYYRDFEYQNHDRQVQHHHIQIPRHNHDTDPTRTHSNQLPIHNSATKHHRTQAWVDKVDSQECPPSANIEEGPQSRLTDCMESLSVSDQFAKSITYKPTDTGLKKCERSHCSHYGNPQCQGLCNECYLKQEKRRH